MIFSQPVAQKSSALQHILKDALVENAKPQIPQSLDNNFKFANLYFNGQKSAEITSLKMSLENFCSFMNAHLQITGDIVKPSNAMDSSVTMEIDEQVEEVNPMEYDSKDAKCLMYQKHSSFHHGSSNSTKNGNTSVSMNYSRNYNMPNSAVQAKAVDSGLHSNGETHSDSNEDDYQRNSKTHQGQLCVSDPSGNEFNRYRNPYALKKKASSDFVQSAVNSSLQGLHTILDETEKPLNTGCDLHYQDKSAPVLQDKSAEISTPCSVSVKDEESLSPEHSIGEHQSRDIEFCCLSEIACDEDCSGLRRKYFGVKSSLKEEKVLILIGNQGTGKTALVNFAANFLKGVEDVDDKLFYIIMDKINGNYHTSSLTAYTFCSARDAVPITIIDTPGLRDCKETEKNNPLQTLKTFFTSSGSNIQLHAIGYVISCSAVDLTLSERHMIDFLVEHYGQRISTNFITIVTSVSYTMKYYPHNDMFKNYGINSKILLKFNNTAFNKKELDDFDRGYWKMGIKNWKRCISHLKKLPPLTMRTLQVKQKQIYSTYMVKSVEEKLKNELKNFILAYKKTNSLTPPVQEKSEQIWRSATALNHLTSSSGCSLNVETVLVKYVDEVAPEAFFSPKECVMLLSLCPARGLLEAGKRMIEFMEPIYAQTKFYGFQKIPVGKKPEFLICKKCHQQHKIKRLENSSKKSHVTYHCTNCSCDESEHVDMKKSGRRENECNIPKEFCLKHTKKAIEKILQEFSVPGYEVNIITFMEIVSQNLDERFRDFINCIVDLNS